MRCRGARCRPPSPAPPLVLLGRGGGDRPAPPPRAAHHPPRARTVHPRPSPPRAACKTRTCATPSDAAVACVRGSRRICAQGPTVPVTVSTPDQVSRGSCVSRVPYARCQVVGCWRVIPLCLEPHPPHLTWRMPGQSRNAGRGMQGCGLEGGVGGCIYLS